MSVSLAIPLLPGSSFGGPKSDFPLPSNAIIISHVQSQYTTQRPSEAVSPPILADENTILQIGLLSKAILETINNEPLLDSSYCQRRTLQVIAAGVSAATKAFFIPIALTLKPGEAFATGAVISWWCFEFYGAHTILEDVLGAKGRNEIILLSNASQRKCRTLIIVGAFGIALISQIVYGFVVYKFNNPNNRIAAVIVTMLSGSLFPTRSLQLSFEKLYRRRHLYNHFEKKLIAIRFDLVSKIRSNQRFFTEVDREKKMSILLSFGEISSLQNEKLQIKDFLTKMLLINSQVKGKQVSKCSQCVTKTAKVVGSLLAATMQASFAYFTWNSTKEYISDNDGTAFLASALVVGSSIYLSSKSILETTNYFAHSFFNLVTCNRELSISEQLYPNTSFCLQLLGIACDVFAQGSGWVIWGDYFGGPVCSSTFILLYTGTLYIVEKVVEEYIRRRGSREDRNILELYDKFKSFGKLLKNNSLLDFAYFLLEIPSEIREKLTGKYNVTYSNLTNYLDIRRT